MLKKTLLIALVAVMAQGAFAETLTPEAALQRARKSGRQIAGSQPALAYTEKSDNGQPAVYVFNQAGGGSLLLSASSLAIPVLGYTDSGSFDPSLMPPQMKEWLASYAAQIEQAEASGIQPKDKSVSFDYPSSWEFIAPLVKTKWDQTKPYNQLIPNSYATGCVATAMAQVMNYHKYPEVGHGSISYKTNYGTEEVTRTMNFAEQPFQWDLMLDDYSTSSYTNQQANAVAYLMKACGFSTEMIYGASSGTQVEKAAYALPTYFGYDGTVEALQRYEYSLSEWANILYDQLKNVGPVIYSGHSLGNLAHAFVCDGYDGQGYFHINWGWSGMCDGYYSLDSMTPNVQGTGGSTSGFNFSQGMVVNIKPVSGTPTFSPEPMMTLLGNMTGSCNGPVLTLNMSQANPGNLVNSSMVTITPTFGIEMKNMQSGAVSYNEVSSLIFNGDAYTIPAMGSGSYIDPAMTVRARFDGSLGDGRYKVTLVWKDRNNDNVWKHFAHPNSCHDYVYVTKEGTKYSMESFPMNRIIIEEAEILTPLYMRNPFEIKFKISNPTDVELSQSIIPILSENGKPCFEGDSHLVSVGPHETIETTLVYTFVTQFPGASTPTTSTPHEYTLGAYDYDMIWLTPYYLGYYDAVDFFGDAYYGDLGTVTMKRPGANSTIRLRTISIDNAVESGSEENYGFVYRINNFSNIDLGVKIECTSGFVAAPLSVVVSEYQPGSNSQGAVVYEKNFENLIYVGSGETIETSTMLHMEDFDPSVVYSAQVYYVYQNTRMALGSVRFGASAGVDEMVAAEGLEISYDGYTINASSEAGVSALEVYDVSGKLVANTRGGVPCVQADATALPAGIYIVKAIAADGNSKTVKIRK